jgi:hypothetical protein
MLNFKKTLIKSAFFSILPVCGFFLVFSAHALTEKPSSSSSLPIQPQLTTTPCIQAIFVHGVLTTIRDAFYEQSEPLNNTLKRMGNNSNNDILFCPTPTIVFWGDLPDQTDKEHKLRDKGNRLINEGNKLINEGYKLIKQNNRDTNEGNKLIKRGTHLKNEGYKQIEEGSRLKVKQGFEDLNKSSDWLPLTKELRTWGQIFVSDQFWLTVPSHLGTPFEKKPPSSLTTFSQRFDEQISSLPKNRPFVVFAHSAGSYAAIQYLSYLKSENPIWSNFLGVVTFGSPIKYTLPDKNIDSFSKRVNDTGKFWYNASYSVDPIAATIASSDLKSSQYITEIIDRKNDILSFGYFVLLNWNHPEKRHTDYWNDGNLVRMLSNSALYREIPFQNATLTSNDNPENDNNPLLFKNKLKAGYSHYIDMLHQSESNTPINKVNPTVIEKERNRLTLLNGKNVKNLELEGFQALRDQNLTKANDSFKEAAQIYSTYHNVSEISQRLVKLEAQLKTHPKQTVNWKNLYEQILTNYSWGMPIEEKRKWPMIEIYSDNEALKENIYNWFSEVNLPIIKYASPHHNQSINALWCGQGQKATAKQLAKILLNHKIDLKAVRGYPATSSARGTSKTIQVGFDQGLASDKTPTLTQNSLEHIECNPRS